MSSPLSSPLSSAAQPSARVAKWLWSGAAIVLAMMPVGMAVAHRSSPVFLIGAAIMVLWAAGLRGEHLDALHPGGPLRVSV